MLKHVNSVRIENFRSIVDPLEVPLSAGVTFLLGPNNSGKSSVLRFLALLLNQSAELLADDVPSKHGAQPKGTIILSGSFLSDFSRDYRHLAKSVQGKDQATFEIVCTLSSGQRPWAVNETLHGIIPIEYFSDGRRFHDDFHSSSSAVSANLAALAHRLVGQLLLPSTVYVPGQRLIVSQGNTLPHFGQVQIPGTSVQLGGVVNDLAELDRPHGTLSERTIAREKLATICELLKYCLEVKNVEIKVPQGQQTIYVSIDGSEQPISHLGSGIEQLLIIGLGSFQFPDRLVLIDEPELHFHPRTQKRMMKFLRENSNSHFVIATHSAAILDSVEADLVQISQVDNHCVGRVITSQVDRYLAVRNLGYSPSDLVLASYVIWVEGPSDRIYLKHWISILAPELIEGTDYAILFYGGSILARHSFDEGDADLVKALSVAKDFAVYMDSDKTSESAALKARVQRVSDETNRNGGFSWVSAGREIENYVPQSAIEQVANKNVSVHSKYERIWSGDNFDKIDFGESIVAVWKDDWPFDLKEKVRALVAAIKKAL